MRINAQDIAIHIHSQIPRCSIVFECSANYPLSIPKPTGSFLIRHRDRRWAYIAHLPLLPPRGKESRLSQAALRELWPRTRLQEARVVQIAGVHLHECSKCNVHADIALPVVGRRLHGQSIET